MGYYIDIGNDKALKLEEWKETFSISQHRRFNDRWFWESVRTVKGKDIVSEKNSPAKIQLGDRATAIAALKTILQELEGEDIPL